MIVLKTSISKDGRKVSTVRFSSGRKTRLGGFGFETRQMLRLGLLGIRLIRQRAAKSIGSNDNQMPPLKKRYAIQKTRLGKGNRRNLSLTGAMLANLSVRYADESKVQMGITSRLARVKAVANERRSPWFGFSPADLKALIREANIIFRGLIADIGLTARGDRSGRGFGAGASFSSSLDNRNRYAA